LGNGEIPDFIKNMQLYSQQATDAQALQQGALEQTMSASQEEMSTECNIPPNGVVQLSKWFDAFDCWLKVTLEKPIEFKVDYSNAQ
jgi:hypothetical protein